MENITYRIVRIKLPVPLLHELDAVILSGSGGYSSRTEFIVDAIQERILEVTTEEAEELRPPASQMQNGSAEPKQERKKVPPQHPSSSSQTKVPGLLPPAPIAWLPDWDGPVSMEDTELQACKKGFCATPTDFISVPEGKYLFGLHNRDYPSLWVLGELAKLTCDKPIKMSDFRRQVTRTAWEYGRILAALERKINAKCTALFPTNPEKRKSAESRFQMFTIGGRRFKKQKAFHASSAMTVFGPLFEWHAIALVGPTTQPLVALTKAGWKLHTDLKGLSVEEPHPRAFADSFFVHIKKYAPSDWNCFYEIMKAIGPKGATRRRVNSYGKKIWPGLRDGEISTNVAGYIARSREWGLVEAEQRMSQYQLTPFGVEQLQ